MIKFLSTLVFLLSVLGCGDTKDKPVEEKIKESQAFDKAFQAVEKTEEWQAWKKAVAQKDSHTFEKAWQALEKTEEWQEYVKAETALIRSDSGRETPQAWHDYINEKLKEEHLRGK